MIRKLIEWILAVMIFALLIYSMFLNVWTWLTIWGITGWICRREIGEDFGPKIVWMLNVLIVLLGGWKLRRVYGRWLWITTEKWDSGIIHEYACPLSIAAKEQEAIWHREKQRSKRNKKNH